MSEATERETSEAGEAVTRPFLAAHAVFVRYVLFAVIAGLANLGAQEATVRIGPAWPLMVSVLAGTGVGFFVKYLLEKRFIFFDAWESHAAELRKITVYGLFGVGTTLLFWAIELGAWHLVGTVEAKYAGAAVGLALGNWIKYLMDKHWVFGRSS